MPFQITETLNEKTHVHKRGFHKLRIFIQYRSANIANFVLAVPLEINNTNKVSKLEV